MTSVLESIRAQPEKHCVVRVDSREKTPWLLPAWRTEVVTMKEGDYGIAGFSSMSNPEFIVERKSVEDLVGSVTSSRERFFREIERMRAYRFAAIIIEGSQREVEGGAYHSQARPESILQTLAAIEVRAGIHCLWGESPEGAAVQFERLCRQFIRGRIAQIAGIVAANN